MKSINDPGLIVAFSHPRGEPITVGPLQELRFDGPRIVATPGGHLATRQDHRWALERGGIYSRIDCAHPLDVCYESHDSTTSRPVGPFSILSAVDGILYADHHIIAFCDEQHSDWYSYDLGSHWRAVVVTPCPQQTE